MTDEDPFYKGVVNLKEHKLRLEARVDLLERQLADLTRACAEMHLVIGKIVGIFPTPRNGGAALWDAVQEGKPIRVTFPIVNGRLRIQFEPAAEEP
jgi:hypothetical protein